MKICIKILVLITFTCIYNVEVVLAQQFQYAVYRNNKEIGWLHVEKLNKGNCIQLQLNAVMKFAVLLQFTATIHEESTFEQGILISSKQVHKVNGNIQTNKSLTKKQNYYAAKDFNDHSILSIPAITNNLHNLYFFEPKTLRVIFCDKQGLSLPITRTTDGGYKVSFPNGDSNCYYYQAGKCTMVKIEHSFYSAILKLKS